MSFIDRVKGQLLQTRAQAAALQERAAARQAQYDALPRAVLLESDPESTEAGAASVITMQPESDSAVPRGLQIGASWAWRVVIIVVMLWGLAKVGAYLSEVVIPLAVAILLTALLSPVCNLMKRTSMPNVLAVAITVIGGLLLVSGALTLIITQIASQSGTLVTQVSTGLDRVVKIAQTNPLLQRFGFDPAQLDTYVTRLQKFVVSSSSTIAGYAAEIGASVGHFLAGFAITIFALFYFLFDGRGIFVFLLKFFPRAARKRVDGAALKGWGSLVHYVRATIIVALVDAVGVLIAALVLQVPLAPALAALVFLGAFVPLVGAFVSGFLAVIVALVALGPIKALIMLACIIFVMQIEGHILQPFLLGRAVKLHPLAVLLGIAIGVVTAGIVGALMSIPLLAFSKSFVQSLAQQNRAMIAGATEPPSSEPVTSPG